jgi:regulator of RNase E activity RraA
MATRDPNRPVSDHAPAADNRLLARCRRIATSTWSDALDQLDIRGAVQGLTVRNGSARIAGRAVTVREEAGPLGTYPVEEFAVGRIIEAITPGCVLVIDIGGAVVSTLGGLAAQAALAREVAGVLIDGGCRDIEEIRTGALWLASRHVTPVSGKRRVRVTGINESVRLGGVDMSQGDYVIADLTGIVVVPAPRIDEALALAEHLESQDRRFREALHAGRAFGEIAATLRHL